MASNETHAEIVREMVEFGNHCAAFGGAYSPERWDNLCKRLNAAHKRELAAKDDERLTIVAMYENVIAAKDAEVAELRECLKIIRDNILSFTIKSEDGKYVNNGGFLSEEFVDDERWRKALEGANNEGK